MGQKIVSKPVAVDVCDICGNEMDQKNRCSYCGKEVCNDCLAHWDEDHAVCQDPGCFQAAMVLSEWETCRKEGRSCGECNFSTSCSCSHVIHPDYFKFEKYA